MRRIIGRLFASRKKAEVDAPRSRSFEAHESTDAKIDAVSDGLVQLLSAGVTLAERYAGMSLHDVADEMLRASPFLAEDAAAGYRAGRPTLAYCILPQVRDEDDVPLFKNAFLFHDHCYDVADARDYACMIETMIGLTQGAWSVDGVRARGPRGQALEFGRPVDISFVSRSPIAPFSLVHAKDFDWTIVDRLNERVPARTEGCFLAAFDGNATIAFLTQGQTDQLANVCRFSFYESPSTGRPS